MRIRHKVLLSILIGLCVAACNSGAPSTPSCPPGTQAMGEPPPNGQEMWCQKTVNGQPVKEGPFVLYRPDGSLMMRGEYRDGKQNGEWTMWYDNGQKASIDHYKDGVQDGEHIGWYTNGKISAIGQYRNGKREGVWKRWDPQGFRNWEEVYKDDKQVS
jgi:antitoxin component YwqK of YwqJK toxin-antitoxin module